MINGQMLERVRKNQKELEKIRRNQKKIERNIQKILIVDDEDYNIDALKILLKYSAKVDVDLVCDSATNGSEALKKVEENVGNNEGKNCNYALILMDCNMPIMDGYEATTRIRKYIANKRLSQPVISCITGHSEQSHAKMAITCGANQVISKPASANTIKKLLTRFPFK